MTSCRQNSDRDMQKDKKQTDRKTNEEDGISEKDLPINISNKLFVEAKM